MPVGVYGLFCLCLITIRRTVLRSAIKGETVKKRLPPLNWLRTFEVSARYLNFTLAATELNMTQAGVSQQIKGLESQLGVALFKRLPRGLELTDAGKAYIPVVHESVERLSLATDEIFGKGRNRLLTIRSTLVFFVHWLAPRIHRFRERYPDIGLRFSSNIWVDEEQKEADLEIRYGNGSWNGFRSERLTWDELLPVCNPVSVMGMSPPKTAEELANHTLLHVVGYEEGWGFWLNQAGFPEVDSEKGIQMDTLISAFEMATLGQGIALGRTSLVADMIESGRLIAPFPVRVPASDAFYLATPDQQYEHPFAETFRNWILEEVSRDRGAGN